MRILALDHGTKRIGAAISDPARVLAMPMEQLAAEPFADFLARVREIIRTHEVEMILVGMPRNMDGSYGEAAARVREFVSLLKETLTAPIQTWDERLTTMQAHRLLSEANVRGKKRKERVDQTSAAVLLQSYLDHLALRE